MGEATIFARTAAAVASRFPEEIPNCTKASVILRRSARSNVKTSGVFSRYSSQRGHFGHRCTSSSSVVEQGRSS